MRRNKFLGKLADFTMNIFMYLSTVLFETGNITKAFFSEGGGWEGKGAGGEKSISPSPTKCTLLTFVIIWPIIYGILQGISYLWKNSLIDLKHKSYSFSKKISGQNDTLQLQFLRFH